MTSYIVQETTDCDIELDIQYNRTYTRSWLIGSDDGTVFGPKFAYNTWFATSGVNPGTVYSNVWGETDDFAVCLKVRSKRLGDKADCYQIDADYGPYDPRLIAANPLERYPVATYENVKQPEPIDYDIYGNALVNSAGQPFQPALERDRIDKVLTIKRNESTFNARYASQYINYTNGDTFANLLPGHVKVDDINGVPKYSSEMGAYFEVEYKFLITSKPEGFTKKLLDAGKYQCAECSDCTESATGSTPSETVNSTAMSSYPNNDQGETDSPCYLVPITVNGYPVSEVIPLNGSGCKLCPDVDYVWLNYDIHFPLNFASVFNFTNVIGL